MLFSVVDRNDPVPRAERQIVIADLGLYTPQAPIPISPPAAVPLSPSPLVASESQCLFANGVYCAIPYLWDVEPARYRGPDPWLALVGGEKNLESLSPLPEVATQAPRLCAP